MPDSVEGTPELLVDTSVAIALVGAAAVEHGLPLATRDRSALDTYLALEVEVELVT